MQTESLQIKTRATDFGAPRVDRALFFLWSKAKNQLSNDQLKWFAGFGEKAEQEACDLADALLQLYCNADENSLDNTREVLLSLAHQAYSIAGMSSIGASAADLLINPELHTFSTASTTSEAISATRGVA
ncbi:MULTISPECIES: hypothetical protein [Methylomonas]|uniref:Uncharacterized protein n=2 Tax=Methylomonas TaxID=416 RepID=A0A140E4S5_9GAMM|nr:MULTISPECIES: hypothetical protein [Methylomonas]AMK75399.1 hypothetical protein JT25_002660 [Methylomonas denitrificans]OAI01187.1 hypothetical protein A1342_19235 [Methylomonas methanica]TCV78093.1 hypothetical protein EDE11_12612 [Methylomonas methanica]